MPDKNTELTKPESKPCPWLFEHHGQMKNIKEARVERRYDVRRSIWLLFILTPQFSKYFLSPNLLREKKNNQSLSVPKTISRGPYILF